MSTILTIVLIVTVASVAATVWHVVAARIATGKPVTHLGTAYVEDQRSRSRPSSTSTDAAK